MEEKLKEIIAGFIRVPIQEIGPATPIDRSAVKSSILLHRMYGRLADEGFAMANYSGIKVYGDLLRKINAGAAPETTQGGPDAMPETVDGSPATLVDPLGGTLAGAHDRAAVEALASAGPRTATPPAAISRQPSYDASAEDPRIDIGIDMEAIAALPKAADFRKEGFYQTNFSAREIAYCILQPDPYASFAGLFAAKEAMVKADASIRNRPFNQLELNHSQDGKPLAPGFSISISHTGGMAVAAAVRTNWTGSALPQQLEPQAGSGGWTTGSWLGWIALLLSITALLIVLFRLGK